MKMQLNVSPSLRHITISTSKGFRDLMKVKISPRPLSYRTILYVVLILAFLLRFLFIFAALATLEGENNCSSLVCLGRKLGPNLLQRTSAAAPRMVKEMSEVLQSNGEGIPEGLMVPESFDAFLADLRANQYDAKTFAFKIKGLELRQAT